MMKPLPYSSLFLLKKDQKQKRTGEDYMHCIVYFCLKKTKKALYYLIPTPPISPHPHAISKNKHRLQAPLES
jgi:hypothetical protein